MKISFLGAADGVTGSRHLVDTGTQKILLDCGLFQGWKLHRERNWQLPGPLLQADAVVLSHAHLDHSGWLPALVARGWRGPVFATPATCELAAVLLLDSAHLQEEDARRANRYGTSRHDKALPLYTRADAQRAIAQFVPVPAGRVQRVGGPVGATLKLTPVGHLLGASAVTLSAGGRHIVFSGDVGRTHDLLMPPPQTPDLAEAADALIIESTYGNRSHPPEDPAARLAEIVRRTVARGGSVLLPAFAVGRAQALLLVLQRLKRSGEIPGSLPFYLDSPMAEQATRLYLKHGAQLRVPKRERETLCDGLRSVGTVAQSTRLSARLAGRGFPAVVISASGMATGGRVLHHLKAMAPDPRHAIVLPGFQAGGTRGARLVAGEREVKIHGEWVPVRAEVAQLQGFSGHADAEGLVDWARRLRQPPRQTFVVHGEPDAADTLRTRIQRDLGWAVRVPGHGETVSL
jgi:metallo-beta-lactamase family protein